VFDQSRAVIMSREAQSAEFNQKNQASLVAALHTPRPYMKEGGVIREVFLY
jgi:hypothetical protein